MSKTQHRPQRLELSEEGKSRKQEMLTQLSQEIAAVENRRQNRRRLMRNASMASVGILAIGCLGYLLVSNLRMEEASSNRTADAMTNRIEESGRKAYHAGAVEPNVKLPNDHQTTAGDSNIAVSNNALATESSPSDGAAMVTMNCVVTNDDLALPDVEKLTDEQLLALLKESGVKAWIAEIDQKRVVITQDGSRL